MKWISVKDRLPDILEDVLVYRISYEVPEGTIVFKMHPVEQYMVAFRSPRGWNFHEDRELKDNSKVSHWMELSKPSEII